MRLAVAAFVLLACLAVGRGMFWMPTIPPHRGDGTFQNLSRRGGLFVAIPGYSISMPEFDLGRPHRAEYRIGGLTDIGRKCGVHLAIRDPNDDWRSWRKDSTSSGTVQLDLLSSDGEAVLSVSGLLSEYIWAHDGRDFHVLYQMDRSYFRPDSGEEYRLRISYEPAPALAGYRGFVYVRSGGTK